MPSLLDDNKAKIDSGRISDTVIRQLEFASDQENISYGDGSIALIEGRTFLRECLRRSVLSAFSLPLRTYASVSEFEASQSHLSASLIVLSLSEESRQANLNAFLSLSGLVQGAPIVILSNQNDTEFALDVISRGAKGYIPVTMGFEIAIKAVRFVLAGGTYAPVDWLLAAGSPATAAAKPPSPSNGMTARELSVVRAIQKGKPNKIIAYELNMCESTVKVHVRHIMKKLSAKNRTDVAIKAKELMRSSAEGLPCHLDGQERAPPELKRYQRSGAT